MDGPLVGVTPLPTEPSRLRQRLRELQIDVVRAYGGSEACAMACRDKVSGIPVVVSVHDTLPSLLYPAIAHADVVLCVSAAVQRLVSDKVHRHDRVWLLPNRVDFSVMRPFASSETADLDDRYPYRYRILHVGRKARQKNLDNVIKALAVLGSDYCLLAVGKGSVDEYAQLAAREGVLDRCFFIDAIETEELSRYFSWSSCMCTPSRWEGFGMVFIEALAAGAIVVTSDIPELAELIAHRENGLLVKDFENPSAIADAIRTACTDGDVRRTLHRRARTSVERFEQGRIDALEAGYYQRVLELRARGVFTQPLAVRAGRSVVREVRRVLPQSVKDAIRPLVAHLPGAAR